MTRPVNTLLCVLGLATAMHLDWHLARPTIHEHSYGLSWHWVFAIPVFALNAWCVVRAWPSALLAASVVIIGGAGVLAAVVEPAWELSTGASVEWAFGPARLGAFAAFLAVGIVTHIGVLALLGRRAKHHNS